ncbi:50s ribosomal protein l11 : 50S ribosomal protein L11 OS=Isosphaera pallida (strain ATCC 43644 / DSM 9630 / IS1B) GN=rplK PE=3 SV=1: Ribosomal_L11_N: Ribosomal_L11 [Gemmataceae bacterium]|nr:50s ribosomal protein l11 : 50S ribosomal protein L11 OS=Isosphaera pallida (strain ATCC 43644 / DSM 9630 / IS1B) GN=rplK PE=3 SV=1: Ribosomal_L11_N: Ribosomal_L11 [Gemmataceae bacterium]VTT98199.1 50s ribosomal protein l11 : 50S ribosomal protein L11 OS=Isosphaera pallida (strain ATCC 43644 / DSM 9630 / IS1B) GN=rplK PE=3 SV=1: Ribosomal_L11_N: Ribosomal_L11 [Gemmataceae bacterium]
MAKQVTGYVKLQCPGGSATPAPPVGPALGAHGVNIGMFVKQFNEKTNNPDMKGLMLPVIITVYSDRSFEFKIKSPPAAVLIKLAAKIPAGKKQGKEVIPAEAKKGGKYKGFSLTKKQVEEIAKKKMADLNARDAEHAARIIEGTARSMGIVVQA